MQNPSKEKIIPLETPVKGSLDNNNRSELMPYYLNTKNIDPNRPHGVNFIEWGELCKKLLF